ncbi:MAG TPA: hypothetical protein VG294_13085 [Solirubrobacteraceae bacterium]|nr:hypothetical protein [Solirubrobacteraceae bacterium]
MAGNDQNPDGRNGSSPSSNVVRLRPRQWLESEDELIPIGGTSPEPSSGTRLKSDPPTPAQADASDSATYWAASDFWGEDAAHVHDAVEAPTPPPRASGVSPIEAARPPAARRFPRVPALAAIAIATAAITAIAINALGSAPGARLSPASSVHANAPARSTSAASAAKSATTAAARRRLTAAASRHRRTQRPHLRVRSRFPRAHARPAPSRHQHRGTAAPATTVVHYVTAAPTSPPASSAYQPAHATSANTPSPAGPTGPASLIGPGTSSSG